LFAIILGPRDFSSEKVSAYECGFNPFEDSRTTFDVKFYLIAVLFIVFDVEVVLLIPLVFSFFLLPFEGLMFIILFLFFLTFGFIYEWKKGALIWS
jgi:NADH-quinone oxidoreductase subunit A